MITGKTLIDMGYKPAPWFAEGIEAARRAEAAGEDVRAAIEAGSTTFMAAPAE